MLSKLDGLESEQIRLFYIWNKPGWWPPNIFFADRNRKQEGSIEDAKSFILSLKLILLAFQIRKTYH